MPLTQAHCLADRQRRDISLVEEDMSAVVMAMAEDVTAECRLASAARRFHEVCLALLECQAVIPHV